MDVVINDFYVWDHPWMPKQATVNNSSGTDNTSCLVPMLRTLVWKDTTQSMFLVDQRKIPESLEIIECRSHQETAHAIKTMAVRGAPAIGVAGGFGMVLAGFEFIKTLANHSNATNIDSFVSFMKKAKSLLDKSRPTAVNLVWATSRMQNILVTIVSSLKSSNLLPTSANQTALLIQRIVSKSLLNEAKLLAEHDIETNSRIGAYGAELIKQNYTILTHCNTGSLATVCGGTALGVIFKAFYDKKNINVFVDETRPRLQGSKLTSWELQRMNIAHKIVVDGSCAHVMSIRNEQSGDSQVDCVIVGCDRVALNGDTANKIGTHTVALVAKEYGVPFYVACPVSTIDEKLTNGKSIVIEERNNTEIKSVGGVDVVCNPDTKCYNPAFDVTPHKYITAFVTEYGICYPPFEHSLRKVKQKQQNDIERIRKQRIDEYVRYARDVSVSKL